MAMLKLGAKTVPVIKIGHLSDAEIKALMIADNKLTENSQWDEELLSQNFLELSELNLDFSLNVTGFEIGEIDMMIEGAIIEYSKRGRKVLATVKLKHTDVFIQIIFLNDGKQT